LKVKLKPSQKLRIVPIVPNAHQTCCLQISAIETPPTRSSSRLDERSEEFVQRRLLLLGPRCRLGNLARSHHRTRIVKTCLQAVFGSSLAPEVKVSVGVWFVVDCLSCVQEAHSIKLVEYAHHVFGILEVFRVDAYCRSIESVHKSCFFSRNGYILSRSSLPSSVATLQVVPRRLSITLATTCLHTRVTSTVVGNNIHYCDS
jgi:hypothetical protein